LGKNKSFKSFVSVQLKLKERKKKMQKLKNKTMAIFFAILMITSTAGALAMFPTATAHNTTTDKSTWTFPSYSYVVPAPDPIGVGQTGAIVMWVDYPLPGALVTNDVRRHNYTLTITKPDGTIESQHWDRMTADFDTTGIQYWQYTPDQVGTYVLKFDYGGQVYTWPGTYNGDIYSPSTRTVNWTVQQDQLPQPVTSYPLPTEYWTHPIEGQNTDWWLISSNWLGSPQIVNRFQPYGAAPNSAHVMWSKAIQEGGVVGGMLGPSSDEPVKTYYMGGSYNVRYSNALIMNGKIYYELPYGNSGSGGGYVCNDLRTGEEIWRVNTSATGVNLVPSFGWLESFDDGNQHGALPNGALIASVGGGGMYGGGGSTYWRAYDPDTGRLTEMNITDVPSGTSVAGPKGSILRLCLVNYGTAAAPNWYLQEWNSTKLISSPGGIGQSGWYTGGGSFGGGSSTINASLASRYDFNKSITLMNGASWTINSYSAYNGYLLLTQGAFGGRADTYYVGNWYGANITCISTKPDTMGQVLWAKFFPAPSGNVTRDLVALDQDNGVLIFEDRELLTHTAYSLTDGSLKWTTPPVDQYDYFRSTTRCAYGNFYFCGYGGILYCYDDATGKLEWTYGNGGEGNSTSSGLVTAWGHYPIFPTAIADGKVFLATTEHSPDSPYYKGALVRAVNATTGAEVWTSEGWGTGMDANYDIAADGYYAFFNGYDSKVYVIGKGPSETSLNIQNNVLSLGNSVLIEGSVVDIAAGTKQDEQIARFPNGVPAMADANQREWMQYVYFQKPRPTNATGVDVTLKVIDPNGNTYDIGTATSDAYGHYSLMYKPEVPGTFTVIASFAGTESYYQSYSEAAFGVADAAPTPTPTAIPLQSVADLYFVPAVAGIIVAIAIVGAVLALLMLRKKPIAIA
jgi:hypothetical protein